MEHIIEVGVFAAKVLIFALGVIVVATAISFLIARGARLGRPQLEVENLGRRFRSYKRALQSQIYKRKELKALVKAEKKSQQALHTPQRRVFVVDFHGDLRAHAAEALREEVTSLLAVATVNDEVVVRLESPGGMVAGYGLAAAQLKRVRDRGINLTVCIDKIAASGGYMMACVANRIVAAPFAIVGSVGVIAAFANVHRVLEKHDVEYREVTAGEFKRTVSLFGEITPQGFEKFKEQIQDTHVLFKEFVHANRPSLDIAAISTGEYWYGTRAKDLHLVDELRTSDEYLVDRHQQNFEVLRIRYHIRRNVMERLSESVAHALHLSVERIASSALWARFGL